MAGSLLFVFGHIEAAVSPSVPDFTRLRREAGPRFQSQGLARRARWQGSPARPGRKEHVSGNTYNVTPPPATKWLTPGHYMLFAVDDTDEGAGTRIKGIPSISKWVQLKDFEQIFITSGQLVGGSSLSPISWTKEDSLLLGDNKYLGTRLSYGPGFIGPRVEVAFNGLADTVNPIKVRLRIQARSTSTARLLVYFKNFKTNAYVQIGSHHDVTNADKDFEIVADNHDFVSPSGEISARVNFRAMSPSFTTPAIFIDLAELGAR
jgi:hypothetical protein